ncbi:hypothetical protein PILCRDRAFT_596500 [Piloderma croceum F 1598]|uniref:Uncharacterized protein n=1 Tax=Piloderma croceum (strain F 1598) TaxID=765440 RepID=A0A0C3BM30_PILCF|nr:hypothetical protein PILCRDRAFT_596500 [Piloderma croceum F 1598]
MRDWTYYYCTVSTSSSVTRRGNLSQVTTRSKRWTEIFSACGAPFIDSPKIHMKRCRMSQLISDTAEMECREVAMETRGGSSIGVQFGTQ